PAPASSLAVSSVGPGTLNAEIAGSNAADVAVARAIPLTGAVHRYQTVPSQGPATQTGSAGSDPAPPISSTSVVEAVAMTSASTNRSCSGSRQRRITSPVPSALVPESAIRYVVPAVAPNEMRPLPGPDPLDATPTSVDTVEPVYAATTVS